MKLNQAKGIHDFNRALAINPFLFQVSLYGKHINGEMMKNLKW